MAVGGGVLTVRRVLQPVGPLDAAVYWRRRAVALVGLALVAALLVWGIAAAASGGRGTPESAPASVPPEVPTAPVVPAAAASGLFAPPGTPTGVLTPPAGTALGPTVPGAAVPPAVRATAGPPARVASCPDSALTVRARTDATRYTGGEQPLLSLVVTNDGSVPCSRDLDAARQGLAVVRSPGNGLWASNDCSPTRSDDVRTLAPGQEAVFSVRWSGRTSSPGCPSSRGPVRAGTYQVLARLDDIVSDPMRFTLKDR